nr:hypothetical protein [uncultured Pedobacter sp.]
MKYLRFLVPVVMLTSFDAKSQTNTFPSTGNGAGLGTLSPYSWFSDKVFQVESTRPTLRLAPIADGDLGTILFKGKFSEGINGSQDEMHLNYMTDSNNPFLELGAYKNAPKTIFRMLASGNIGIGTQYPKSLLDVGRPINGEQLGAVLGRLTEGDGQLEGTFLGVRGYGTQLNDYDGKSFALEHSFYGKKNSSINFYRGQSQTGGFITFSTFDNTERMRISPFGNVGIGTNNPTEKLSVNGNIRAKEIKVEAANWPDYVFDKDYKILGLDELNAYIKQHKHLPEMPSAKETETNGVELGEMNKLLLKKVEELTLHLIEKDEQLKLQAQKNTTYENRLKELEKKIK